MKIIFIPLRSNFQNVRIMPKVKTHSSAKKRFKVTGSGKVKRFQAYTSHMMRNKSKKAKLNLRGSSLVSKADEKRVKALLGLKQNNMPRSVNSVASRSRRKKILKSARGYWGARSKVYTVAKNAVEKAGVYAYRDRKAKKGEFRKLWIVRINAAAKQNGTSYSKLMHGLSQKNIGLNRKVLADLAMNHPDTFTAIVKEAVQ